MCDWGPAPTDADPAPSNGIDWTADRVARVALALDASTAAYGNNTVNGVMLTTIESICPSLNQDYDRFQLFDFATMDAAQCGGVMECAASSMDTQAYFGLVKASAAPSGQREIMISFRGTEMSDTFSSLQKFQDLVSDLNIGRKFLYINQTGGPCTDDSQCQYLGYVHEGFYDALAPFMDTILMGITDIILDINNITSDEGDWHRRVAQLISRWDTVIKPEITISGHSLGSAIASIAASVVTAVFKDVHVHLYTFASPRVGGPTWVSGIEAQQDNFFDIVRIVNKHDPVTMIPTSLGAGDVVIHLGPQETLDFASISSSCKTWFLDSQYALISAGISYATGCLDVASHTDYHQHVVTWLRSKGYSKPQQCSAGSV